MGCLMSPRTEPSPGNGNRACFVLRSCPPRPCRAPPPVFPSAYRSGRRVAAAVGLSRYSPWKRAVLLLTIFFWPKRLHWRRTLFQMNMNNDQCVCIFTPILSPLGGALPTERPCLLFLQTTARFLVSVGSTAPQPRPPSRLHPWAYHLEMRTRVCRPPWHKQQATQNVHWDH